MQRRPRQRDPEFLAFLRTKPCVRCGHAPPSQAAHIRFSDAAKGHVNPGVGAKPDDSKATPLCAECHLTGPDAQHSMSEREFWRRAGGLDPFDIAACFYAEFAEIRKTVPPNPTRKRKKKPAKPKYKYDAPTVFVQRTQPVRREAVNRWPPKGSRTFQSRRP